MELRAETSVFDDKLLKEDIDNAQETADNAQVIAGTTAQYFWFLEEIGSVPAGVGTGAHITNVTKEEFLNNPANGGGNLLARSNGIAIRDGLTELAIFSADQLRIGRANTQRVVVNSGSLELYNAQNNRYFMVSANSMTYGTHTVADTAYADSKASAAQSAAEKVAKDYLYIDGNGALNIASANPSTATRKVNISSDGIKIQNDANNYALVESNGMDIYQGGNSAAFFGATARIGKKDLFNVEIYTADAAGWGSLRIKQTTKSIASLSGNKSSVYSDGYNAWLGLCNSVYAYEGNGVSCNARETAKTATTTLFGSAVNSADAGVVAETDRNKVTVLRCFAAESGSNNKIIATYSIQVSSDRRLKEHLSYLGNEAIEFVRQLKPAYFKKGGGEHIGFYAQDVEEIDKWHALVSSDEEGLKSLAYTEMIAPLVTYCQHLEHRIEELEKR